MTPSEIRERRLAYPLTVAELAGRVGCTESAVRQWEYGLRTPKPRFMRALRSVFAGECGGKHGGCACRCHVRSRQAWSLEEEAHLAESIARGEQPDAIAAGLRERFGRERSRAAVVSKVSDLGLTFRLDRWLSQEDVRRLLGLASWRVVRDWRTRGLLPARRWESRSRGEPSTWWQFERADLEAFVDRHAGALVDPAKVRDRALRERAIAAAARRQTA